MKQNLIGNILLGIVFIALIIILFPVTADYVTDVFNWFAGLVSDVFNWFAGLVSGVFGS